ncbi:SDR family oxidoreductase [Kiloniella laminariae]|uniref:SDR family oxidoreductase n=1 Tax=Kiloniella laminariae TaxID=454162 RepID=A0ABT4LMR4_9PROT|nr:SDR family oxidoreductase [Kiloniella laminariae]MCZ4282180.1 SDR family oxidoreductase [Kiloniella laminariae]
MARGQHEGRRVLVTAGAAGIGKAAAEVFLREGARVHICDIDQAALNAFEGGTRLSKSLLDVTDEAAVSALFEKEIAELGGLDVLVNNAGIAGPAGALETLDYREWQRCVSVNIDSQFLFSRAAIPLMKQQESGAIINLSSTAGLFGFPMRSPYAAAKWAVIGLTKTMAMELGPFGIRVNAIAPGSVAGPRMDRVIDATAKAQGVLPEEVRRNFESQVSLRTFVTASDIANMISFACSEAGARISGQVLAVDGHTENLSS